MLLSEVIRARSVRASFGVGKDFEAYHGRIVTPGNGSISFWGLADKNAESIKSLEGCHICWLDLVSGGSWSQASELDLPPRLGLALSSNLRTWQAPLAPPSALESKLAPGSPANHAARRNLQNVAPNVAQEALFNLNSLYCLACLTET